MKGKTKERILSLIFGVFIGISGLYLISAFDGWQEALGAFCLIWSHNIDRH